MNVTLEQLLQIIGEMYVQNLQLKLQVAELTNHINSIQPEREAPSE